MADEVERIKIEIDDTDAKAKTVSINAGLESVEKKAGQVSEAATQATEAQVERIVRVTQTSKSAIERTVASYQKSASILGATPAQVNEQKYQAAVRRASGDTEAVNKLAEAYKRVQQYQQRIDQANVIGANTDRLAKQVREANDLAEALRRAAKEKQNLETSQGDARQNILFNAQRRGATGTEAVALDKARALQQLIKNGGSQAEIAALNLSFKRLEDQAVQSLSSVGAKLQNFLVSPAYAVKTALADSVGSFGLLALGGAAAFAAVGFAAKKAYDLIAESAEKARGTVNLSQQLGSTVQQAKELQIAAQISGVEVGSLTGFIRKLSQAVVDGGEEGKKGAKALREIGVAAFDSQGKIKGDVQLLNEIGAAISSIPDAAVQEAKISAIGGRGAVQMLPLLLRLREVNGEMKNLDKLMSEDTVKSLAAANDQIQLFTSALSLLKDKAANGITIVVGFTLKSVGNLKDIIDHLPGIKDLGDMLGHAFGQLTDEEKTQADMTQKLLSTINERAKDNSPLAQTVKAAQTAFENRADSITTLTTKIKTEEAALGDLQAKFSGRNFGENIAGEKAAEVAIRNAERKIEADKEYLKVLNEIPGAEKAAHEYALTAQKEYQEAILKTKAVVRDATALDVGHYEAVAKAFATYTEKVKSNKDQGTLTPKVSSELLVGLNENNLAEVQRYAQASIAALNEYQVKHKDLLEQQFRDQQSYEEATLRLKEATINAAFNYEQTQLSQSRDAQLRAVENTDAKTLDQAVLFNLRKGEIEAQYIRDRAQLETEAIDRSSRREIEALQAEAKARPELAAQASSRILAINEDTALREKQIRLSADADVNKAREEAAIKSAETIRNANTRIFDTFKRESEGIFDSLLRGHKSLFAAIGDSLKNVLLTGIKDVVSSQIARGLTSLFTGQQVGLTPATVGAGPLAGFLSAIGFGAKPTFGSTADQVGEISRIHLVDGSMPVHVTNSTDLATANVRVSESSVGGNSTSNSNSSVVNQVFSILGNASSRAASRAPLAASLSLLGALGGLGSTALPAAAGTLSVGGSEITTPGFATSTISFPSILGGSAGSGRGGSQSTVARLLNAIRGGSGGNTSGSGAFSGSGGTSGSGGGGGPILGGFGLPYGTLLAALNVAGVGSGGVGGGNSPSDIAAANAARGGGYSGTGSVPDLSAVFTPDGGVSQSISFGSAAGSGGGLPGFSGSGDLGGLGTGLSQGGDGLAINGVPLYPSALGGLGGLGAGGSAKAAVAGGLLKSLGSIFGKGISALANQKLILSPSNVTTPATLARTIGGLKGKLVGGGAALAEAFGLPVGLALLAGATKNPYSPGSAITAPTGGALAGFSIGSKIPGLGAVGGAVVGAGAGLFLNGYQRGGVAGLAETTAGGALAGFKLGGPIGAAIGAGVGALVGGLRLAGIITTKTEDVRNQIKAAYGVEIKDTQFLQRIVDIVNQQYGGNVATAILSLPVRQMIELYAQTTGQGAKGIVAHAQSSQFSNTRGSLTQVPSYFNGSPVLPGQTQSTFGILTPFNSGGLTSGNGVIQGANVVHNTISLDAEATTALLQGQAVQTIQGNGRLISAQAADGSSYGSGTRQLASNMLSPSAITT